MSAETSAPSAAEVEALAERIISFVGQCIGQADPQAGVVEMLSGYVSPARHPAEVQAARAEAYKDAANEVHIEARWQAEQGARQVSVSEGVWRSHFGDRLAVVERILRDRADGEAKA